MDINRPGVPQGSVLGPLLFDKYLNDLFMFLEESKTSHDADDTTIYVCGSVMYLENDARKITEWFPNNGMKLNEDKCHLLILGAKGSNKTIKIREVCVKESGEEHIFGTYKVRSITFFQGTRPRLFVKRSAKSSILLLKYHDTWTQKSYSG